MLIRVRVTSEAGEREQNRRERVALAGLMRLEEWPEGSRTHGSHKYD